MKKKRLLRIALIGCVVLLCLTINARTRPARRSQGITLWYTEEDCPRELMESALALCRQETGSWVEGVCFPDEEALGEAFETGRPDLLFCSHVRAAQLDRRETLAAIASPLPVPAALEGLRPAAGASFFPVGSRLPLLLVNTALCDTGFPDFETLLSTAGKKPFVISGCWAEALYAACAAKGDTMTGIPAEDGENETYAALYNLIAGAAFRGGLLAGDEAVDRVRLGEIPCAVVRSTEVASVPRSDLTFRVLPLPLPKGGETARPAELMGFALLGGADTEAAARFLQWLWNGRCRELAFAAGLVPIADAYTGAGGDSAFGELLAELAGSGALYWPDADEAFFQNRGACEREMRDTLDLLAGG